MSSSGSLKNPSRLLVTAGPTHEPIDAVRYVANRSSGRTGIAIAESAARRGWRTTMLLGPSCLTPEDTSVATHRFRTTADLEALLARHTPSCDILIMAAAVADYRPATTAHAGKIERREHPLTLSLEPTPDLLAGLAANKRSDQYFVGFALGPAKGLEASAVQKLAHKGLDAIVANPLETMDSDEIEAVWLVRGRSAGRAAPRMTKGRFAEWLLDRIAEQLSGEFTDQ